MGKVTKAVNCLGPMHMRFRIAERRLFQCGHQRKLRACTHPLKMSCCSFTIIKCNPRNVQETGVVSSNQLLHLAHTLEINNKRTERKDLANTENASVYELLPYMREKTHVCLYLKPVCASCMILQQRPSAPQPDNTGHEQGPKQKQHPIPEAIPKGTHTRSCIEARSNT